MSKRRRTFDRLARLKALKIYDTEEDEEQKEVAEIATTVAQLLPPPIFVLNNHCCYEIFSWLSLEDLHSFGQTCKWAQQVAGNFYQMNHSAIEVNVGVDNFTAGGTAINGFSKFFQNVRIAYHTSKVPFRKFKWNCGESIKQLRLSKLRLSTAKINYLKNVLQTVECLKIEKCEVKGDVYEKLLRFCPKLKCLCIWDDIADWYPNRHRFDPILGTKNTWLLQKYPTVEQLELCPQSSKIDEKELETFFKQNPNVKSFAIHTYFLSRNLSFFQKTNMKLDRLAIRCERYLNGEFICKLLNELYDRGAYKWLTLYSNPVDGLPKEIDSLNAQRVRIDSMNSENILLCIRNSMKLKEIEVGRIVMTGNSEKKALDLATWNGERKLLTGAQKIIIYVDKGTFLATKKTTQQTNFELVELKPNSNEYDRDFDYAAHEWYN